MTSILDIGHGHQLRFFGWHPDRDLNPQYADRPDVDRVGAHIAHPRPDGNGMCEAGSGLVFDQPGAEFFADDGHRWQVESWEPLTISPSVLCRLCGDHGWIRLGRWVAA